MPVSNGVLTIEKVFDDKQSQRTYVFSLTNSIALGAIDSTPDHAITLTDGSYVTLTDGSYATTT